MRGSASSSLPREETVTSHAWADQRRRYGLSILPRWLRVSRAVQVGSRTGVAITTFVSFPVPERRHLTPLTHILEMFRAILLEVATLHTFPSVGQVHETVVSTSGPLLVAGV
ncbi:MAG: hypothetical protein KDA52_01180 [Planctomycetaceae bacterium]|nr:hypothetical protein [Planctomycetaceae bacterium]